MATQISRSNRYNGFFMVHAGQEKKEREKKRKSTHTNALRIFLSERRSYVLYICRANQRHILLSFSCTRQQFVYLTIVCKQHCLSCSLVQSPGLARRQVSCIVWQRTRLCSLYTFIATPSGRLPSWIRRTDPSSLGMTSKGMITARVSLAICATTSAFFFFFFFSSSFFLFFKFFLFCFVCCLIACFLLGFWCLFPCLFVFVFFGVFLGGGCLFFVFCLFCLFLWLLLLFVCLFVVLGLLFLFLLLL